MSTSRLWTLADRVDLSPEVSNHIRQVASPGQQPSRPTVASTRESLERLCREGFLGDAVPTAESRDLARTAGVLATLAWDDLSMAFVAWAHRIAIEYVTRSHGGAFPDETIRGLTRGHLIGATAMAPAFQANLGLRDVDVRATKSGDRLVVDGRIGWASNLHPDGSVIVFAPRHTDGSHGRSSVAMGAASYLEEVGRRAIA